MKKVLIISFLIFTTLLNCSNTIFAASDTNSTPDQVVKLTIGESYIFNDVESVDSTISSQSFLKCSEENINAETGSFSYRITAVGVGETTGFIYINGESKTVHIKTAKRFLQNVVIVPPAKTRYNVGEKLDLTGLKITAIYDNQEIEDIEKGYKITGYNKNKKGIQTVTISYGNFSRSYKVNVGNVSSVNLDKTEKLPQTGDFFDLVDGLYLLIGILSIALISIVYKSVKNKKA